MKPDKFYSSIIAYTFIFIGFGLILEWLQLINPEIENLKVPLRYFYWVFNIITLSHLLLLIVYKAEENEQKKTRLLFFSVVNHFFVSLIAIALYALIWLEGIKEEGAICAVMYMVTFVYFIYVVTAQAKD